MKPLLSALLLLALFAPMPAQALSDRDHQRYLQECPAYREADRQINEAWKKLKGFCGKERFREELAEQRSWLKNRDSMTEDARRQGEDTASAAARVMLERVAILNCKICQFDPSWVTFSIQYDVRVPCDEETAAIAIVPSRPVLMNWYYTVMERRPASEKVNRELLQGMRYRYTDILEGRVDSDMRPVPDGLILDYAPGSGDGGIDYSQGSRDLYAFSRRDTLNVTFENSSLVCVTGWTYSSIGMARGRGMGASSPTRWFDLTRGCWELEFDDLFASPEAAKTILRGLAMQKVQEAAAARERSDPSFRQGDLDTLLEQIAGYDFSEAWAEPGRLMLPLDRDAASPLNGRPGSLDTEYLENPLPVPFRDFLPLTRPKFDFAGR